MKCDFKLTGEMMNITCIEIIDTFCPEKPDWNPVFVRITTDSGHQGVGEAGLAYDLGHSAAAQMIKELAESVVLHADPFDREKLWQRMLRESFWGLGGGPVIYAAISAIDTALWDIQGKVLGRPCYDLLGGKTNASLKTYASQLQFDWDCKQRIPLAGPEAYAEAAQKAVDEGYDWVKVDPMMFDKAGYTLFDCSRYFDRAHLKLIRDRLSAIQEALGPNGEIIFECHSLPGVGSALQLGKIAETFGCVYFEEPVNYLNDKLHQPLKSGLNVPIAAGERIYLRHGVRPYLEAQTIDVLQPDIGLCGGMGEAKKICDYADMYDVKIQLHVCGGPVATAAALHLETAIPNFLVHEHHTYALKHYNRRLATPDLQPENGLFKAPSTPGLGIALNDAALNDSNWFIVR